MEPTFSEILQFNQSVIHNFELSIIMSFSKHTTEFSWALKKNAVYLQRNGIEVIIVLDNQPEEQALLNVIKQYPLINWKLIVNDEVVHEPRNYGVVLNVGIRHASKKYILVTDPEVYFHTDVIFQLRTVLEHYPNSYAMGTCTYIEKSEKEFNNVENLIFMPYGSIMLARDTLNLITGYDESITKWGGEDDNIRRRLDYLGIRKMFCSEVKSVHYGAPSFKNVSYKAEQLEYFLRPLGITPNTDTWGKSFGRTSYDWENKIFAQEMCLNYLFQFVTYEIGDTFIFEKSYRRILLCQSYNELKHVRDFLDNMGQHFDAIIMLDDSSTDGTYENAIHDRLILKIKKVRTCFNDLENRNILLDVVSFFKTEWICFMDFDERFDERFCDFDQYTQDKANDVLEFAFVNLWDNEQTYRIDYPGANQYGILYRKRMFRNMGRCQLHTLKKQLHFAAVPHRKKMIRTAILFKHLGMLWSIDRKRKYQFYRQEDLFNDQPNYEHINDQYIKKGLLSYINNESFNLKYYDKMDTSLFG